MKMRKDLETNISNVGKNRSIFHAGFEFALDLQKLLNKYDDVDVEQLIKVLEVKKS